MCWVGRYDRQMIDQLIDLGHWEKNMGWKYKLRYFQHVADMQVFKTWNWIRSPMRYVKKESTKAD